MSKTNMLCCFAVMNYSEACIYYRKACPITAQILLDAAKDACPLVTACKTQVDRFKVVDDESREAMLDLPKEVREAYYGKPEDWEKPETQLTKNNVRRAIEELEKGGG